MRQSPRTAEVSAHSAPSVAGGTQREVPQLQQPPRPVASLWGLVAAGMAVADRSGWSYGSEGGACPVRQGTAVNDGCVAAGRVGSRPRRRWSGPQRVPNQRRFHPNPLHRPGGVRRLARNGRRPDASAAARALRGIPRKALSVVNVRGEWRTGSGRRRGFGVDPDQAEVAHRRGPGRPHGLAARRSPCQAR